MTKHFVPAGRTEPTGNDDYIRPYDSATMRWDGKGSFVRVPGKFVEEVSKDTRRPVISEEDTGPVIGETESFDDSRESPKYVSWKYVRSERDKPFDREPSEEEAEAASEKDSFEEDGKRRVKNKPRCNPVPSKTRQAYYARTHVFGTESSAIVFDVHEQRIVERIIERTEVKADKFPLSLWAGNKVFDISLKPYTTGRPISRWRTESMTALLDTVFESQPADIIEAYEASGSRARQERYSIEASKNESDILPRKSRNKSPSEPWRILVWAEYRRLNGSLEHLQTIFGKSDGVLADFPSDADGEGGAKPEAKYPLDSTLQNRPSVQELAASWPAAKYETRMVRCKQEGETFRGKCPLRRPADASFMREMKIPVSGKVDVLEYANDKSKRRFDDADVSIAGYRQRYKENHAPAHWPDPKRKTQKQIGVVRDRTAEQELGVAPRLLHISEVDKTRTRKWHFHRIGGLRFAPNGHLIKYGTWYTPMVDVPRKAKGPEFFGSDPKYWESFHPLTRKTRMEKLSGAEHAEQLGNKEQAKQLGCKYAPEPCRSLFHERVGDPSRPYAERMIGRRHPMPYLVKYEPPGRDYAFGSAYTLPEVPADDVVERGSQLRAVNAMLSPQGLIVANAIVKTELTRDLASSNPDIGALLWKGGDMPSESTLERNGKKAREETEEELRVIFQKLAV